VVNRIYRDCHRSNAPPPHVQNTKKVHYLHINDYLHQEIHQGNIFAAFIKDETWMRAKATTGRPRSVQK
jgi:hypothetical protein